MLALKMAIEVQRQINYIQALKQVPSRQRELEARLNRKLGELFSDVGDRTVRELLAVTSFSDDTTRRSIVSIVEDIEDEFQRIMLDGATDAAQYGRNRILRNLQQVGISINFEQASPMPDRVSELMRQHSFQASERTMQRVTSDIMENIVRSYEEGLGTSEAAERLQQRFDQLKTYEAERIARTETHVFQNEAAHSTMQEMGVEFEKWIMAGDERVRGNPDGLYPDTEANHWDMDGEITRLGDAFSNGLHYPGDRSGAIEEWINCRCRVVPFIMPEGKRPPDKQWFFEQDLIAA